MKAKWIMPLIIILSSFFPVYAQKITITDLMYIVPTGKLLSDTNLSLMNLDYETKLGSSTATSKFSSKQIVIEETLRFGLINNLEIGTTFGYLFGGENELVSTSDNITISNFSGLRDVNILSKYRLLKAENSFANLDLRAEFSPGFGNREDATTSDDGNAFRGGHKITLGADLGRDMPSFAWAIGLDINILTSQTLDNPSTGEQYQEESSRTDLYFYGKGQVYIGTHSLDFGLSYEMNGSYNRTTVSTEAVQEFDSSGFFHLETAFNYSIDQDFYISPYIDYAFGADLNSSTEATSSITQLERSKMELGISVKYQF